jgi:arylsulfatase A-like enzyme
MNKKALAFYCFITSFALCCSLQPLRKKQLASRPNIIIIFTDDQGYRDVGCFGATDFETPNLDRLAREGARLTQFYTAQPVCSAARAALLTGCYPNRIGIHQALMPNAAIGLNPSETTIADMLKANGYATAIFGKWHLGDAPQFMPNRQGFDTYFGIPYSGDMWPKHPQQGTVFQFGALPLYENEKAIDTLWDQTELTAQITAHCVEFIREQRDKPFFLYVPHPQPHVPLYVSGKFKGKSKQGLYGDVIMELDWSVGQIMDALKKYGLEERTLVIFSSDNGPWLAYGNHAGSAAPLREGKGTVWEGGVREPCIMRFPGKIPAGSTLETPIMTIDLLPTIAALTGSALPALKIDGKNALPVLTGTQQQPLHDLLFFYYNQNEMQAVRYSDWKLYFPHSYRSMGDNPPGRDGLPGQYKLVQMDRPELYNLKDDPTESHDVAGQYPAIVARIQEAADSMRLQLGDKLRGIEGAENRLPGRKSNEK